MESLTEKLKSLGVRVGARGYQSLIRYNNIFPIEKVIKGEEDLTPFGSTFIVQKGYPGNYHHGKTTLCMDLDLEILAQWIRSKQLAEFDLKDYVFLDTETSGLSGGTGTFVFMIGLGFHTETGFKLIQLFLRDPSQEMALITSLNRLIDSFSAVVSFNGKSFDIPILNTRCVLNGFSSPFSIIEHVDLLHLARRLWRNRLPSRALVDLESDIIRFSQSQEEVPGWMIPRVYFNYLRTGDARPISGIFYHNSIDILTLAVLFNGIIRMINNPLGDLPIHSLDLISIAHLYEDLGHLDIAGKVYERCLQQDLPELYFQHTLNRFALLNKRKGNWNYAIQLWQMATEFKHIEAGIELAKYYEHKEKNYVEAQKWTKLALEWSIETDDNIMPPTCNKELISDLNWRLTRLSRKEDPQIN